MAFSKKKKKGKGFKSQQDYSAPGWSSSEKKSLVQHYLKIKAGVFFFTYLNICVVLHEVL